MICLALITLLASQSLTESCGGLLRLLILIERLVIIDQSKILSIVYGVFIDIAEVFIGNVALTVVVPELFLKVRLGPFLFLMPVCCRVGAHVWLLHVTKRRLLVHSVFEHLNLNN